MQSLCKLNINNKKDGHMINNAGRIISIAKSE